MAPQQGDPKRRGQHPPVDPYADLIGPSSSAPSDDPYADLIGPAPVASSRQANDPGGDVDLRDPLPKLRTPALPGMARDATSVRRPGPPATFRDSVQAITGKPTLGTHELPPLAMRVLSPTMQAGGTYHPLLDAVSIDKTQGEKPGDASKDQVFAHEMGHRLGSNLHGDPKARAAFDSATSAPSKKLTGYYSDPNEHFAEALANAFEVLRNNLSSNRGLAIAAMNDAERQVPGTAALAQYLLDQPLYANHPMQQFRGDGGPHRKDHPQPPSLAAAADATAAPPTARERYRPNAVERFATGAAGLASEAVHHPGKFAASLVTAPLKSATDAVLSPTIGDPRHDPRLSKGGNSANLTPGMIAQPYDREHGAITEKERALGAAQTLANIAMPGIERAVSGAALRAGSSKVAGKIAGMAAAGVPAGAAYSPDDPAVGALLGATLGGTFGVAGEGISRGVRKVRDVAVRAAGGETPTTPRPGETPAAAPEPSAPESDWARREREAADRVRAAKPGSVLEHDGERYVRRDDLTWQHESEPSASLTSDDAARMLRDESATLAARTEYRPLEGLSNADLLGELSWARRAGDSPREAAIRAALKERAPASSSPESAPPIEPEPVSTLDQATRAAEAAEWVQRFERDSKSAPKRRRFANVIDAESMEAILAGDDAALERHLTETHGADRDTLLDLLSKQHSQVTKYGVLRSDAINATIQRAMGRVHAIHGDRASFKAFSGEAQSGFDAAEREMRPKPAAPDPRTAAVPPHESLARFGPTMYHETSLERAVRLLDPSVMEEASPLYLASVPELALGQGSNKGVHIEFDAGALRGEPNTAKPGLAFTAQQGAGEFIARNAQRDYQAAVRSITLAPGAGSRGGVWVARARRLFLPALERAGWTTETLADGSVRYSRPGLEAETALRGTQEPAGATETPSPYSDLFGEQAPEKIKQGGLFGEQAGTEGSRPLAAAERAARSELDQLRTRYDGTNDPAARQAIAARMAQLEKLTNRGEKIGADELGRRAVAAGSEADPYGDLTGEPAAPKAPKPPAVPDDWFNEPDAATGTAAPTKKSGVVLEDGVKRFESARRGPTDRLRPVGRVTTEGLLQELLDMEQRRANAEGRSVHEVREDPNFHTSGIPQIVSTKPKGGGPSMQAKAFRNLEDFARSTANIHAELEARGLTPADIFDLVEDRRVANAERAGLAGDFDPRNAGRDPVRNDAGDVLFSQTPDAFKEEPPTRASGVEIAQARAEQGGTTAPRTLSGPRQALAVATVKANAFKDAAQRVFAPASRSKDAGSIALAIREHMGDFARRNEQARESFKDLAGAFDRMPDTDRLDFIDRIETGRPQATPTLQGAADLMRRLLDDGRDAIHSLGTGKLEHWIQNYFPHLWADESAAVTFIDRVMSKRSLSGPGTFLKRRSIPTLREGIEAGLEPLTTNPVDMTLLKLREMNRYLAGQRILAEMKEMGFAKFVSALEKAPEGLVKLDDKLGTVYGPPEVQVTEGFDKLVREQLTRVIQELGVTHTRTAKIGGRGRMGFAEGTSKITTKAGGPDTVIEHELGHVLDAKLGVWDRLTDIPGKTRQAIDARKQLHTELRALADMRYEGMDPDRLPKAFKDYVRKKEEKIANAVHALVYLPDRMEEVAPMVKARLTSILQGHPVAAKLLEVKPSLVLGTSDYSVPAGGLVVRGHWYVPEPVARVVNNHLSPGLRGNPFYNLYRGVGNSMNQWQLGFSAFHLGFTSMDAAVSKTALGIEQLAAGQPRAGLRSMAETPIAPISNYLRGSKVLREYLAPGTEGGEMAAIVDALVKGGGRVRMDEFYGGGAIKQFREALTRGKKLRAGRLSLGALTEVSSRLVMERIVPRQKLGVFADLARFELSKLPENATKEEARAAMAHAWDSVDNRLGQVVYDNLFWNRAAKDLTMASVRSVGWNLGTIRELGGGIADLQAIPRRLTHRAFKGMGLPGDWQGASEPVGFTHRAAYVMALPITVGLAGGIVNYLYTGEPPRELKDWYYPRTGRKNPDGTDERVQLMSYIRDVGDYGRHPVQTLANKLHPLAGVIRDMLQNEDFYGHEIHNPDDPMVQQAQQEALYIAQQFEPFGVHNAREQWARGRKRDALFNFIGITPAPREVTRTPADLRMSQELGRRASGRLTPEEVDRQQQRRGALDALRSHSPNAMDAMREAVESGALKPRDLKSTLRDATLPPDVLRFQHLSLAEAMRVYQLATPEERARFGPVLFQKLRRARQQGAPIPSMPFAAPR